MATVIYDACAWVHCTRPGYSHSVSFTRIQFHIREETPLTNLAEVTVPGMAPNH